MDKQIKNKILKKINEFEEIPVFSNQIKNLIDTAENNETKIIETLKYEIPITANILKLANSSMFNISKRINSIDEVVSILGFEELKKLITMTTTTSIFSKGSGYEMNKGEMRRHAIASAIISKYLDKYLPEDIKGDLFTACLIADIGKVILSDEVDSQNYRITNLVKNKGIDFLTAEEEVFGLSHAQIGAKVLEKWGFSPEMVKAVRYHHEPDKVPELPLAHFISLSGTIAMLAGFTTGIDGLDYKGFPELFKKYGIKQKDIQLILMESIVEIKKIIPYKLSTKKENRE